MHIFTFLMVFVLQKNAHVCHIRRSVAAQVSVVPRSLFDLFIYITNCSHGRLFMCPLVDTDYRFRAFRSIISVWRLGPPITKIITFIIYKASVCKNCYNAYRVYRVHNNSQGHSYRPLCQNSAPLRPHWIKHVTSRWWNYPFHEMDNFFYYFMNRK